jgi:hypothetical protein
MLNLMDELKTQIVTLGRTTHNLQTIALEKDVILDDSLQTSTKNSKNSNNGVNESDSNRDRS